MTQDELLVLLDRAVLEEWQTLDLSFKGLGTGELISEAMKSP
jgi:hypothetical protein